MNNKQLAEMIKRLRKEKQDELAMTDMNTTSNMKGAGHDIIETMRDPPPPYKRLSPDQHQGAIRGGIIRKRRNLAGRTVQSKYTFEEKKQVSNTKSTIINTTPEQDSAMIGTQ